MRNSLSDTTKEKRRPGHAAKPLSAALLCICLACCLLGCAAQGPSDRKAGLYLPPGEYSNFSMGDRQIRLPGPSGGMIKPAGDPMLLAASAWLTPPENIFSLYEKPYDLSTAVEKRAEAARMPRNRVLVIVSALPEFMDERISGEQYRLMRADLSRSSGVWQADAAENFLRLSGLYSLRSGLTHNLGVYHSTGCSISNARIVKEFAPTTRTTGNTPTGLNSQNGALAAQERLALAPDLAAIMTAAGPLQAAGSPDIDGDDPDEAFSLPASAGLLEPAAGPKADDDFASGNYVVSIRNLLCLGGKVFNVYYNMPLYSLADLTTAMEDNASYMESIARNAVADSAPTGAAGLNARDWRNDRGGNEAESAISAGVALTDGATEAGSGRP